MAVNNQDSNQNEAIGDAAIVAGDAYKVVLENEFVRILELRMEPPKYGCSNDRRWDFPFRGTSLINHTNGSRDPEWICELSACRSAHNREHWWCRGTWILN
jgi:hypothetical protein